jgi:hypothetical protein
VNAGDARLHLGLRHPRRAERNTQRQDKPTHAPPRHCPNTLFHVLCPNGTVTVGHHGDRSQESLSQDHADAYPPSA